MEFTADQMLSIPIESLSQTETRWRVVNAVTGTEYARGAASRDIAERWLSDHPTPGAVVEPYETFRD